MHKRGTKVVVAMIAGSNIFVQLIVAMLVGMIVHMPMSVMMFVLIAQKESAKEIYA